jgi:hypothetical protein
MTSDCDSDEGDCSRVQRQQAKQLWGKGGRLALEEAERDREERYFDE